jgi:hypothetical protein
MTDHRDNTLKATLLGCVVLLVLFLLALTGKG